MHACCVYAYALYVVDFNNSSAYALAMEASLAQFNPKSSNNYATSVYTK